jgi:MGT family glycosyltransferase
VYSKDLDSFLSARGVTTSNNLWHTEPINIHLIPREFQYAGDGFDSRFLFVGALLDRSFEPKWSNRSSGRPIALISGLSGLHGTDVRSSTNYEVFLEALANSEFHCIFSIGEDESPDSLGLQGSNFEVNRHASHLEILPHASVFVCHGGMLSTLEALYNGVPVLSLPIHQFTHEVAYRTAELGLGIKLARDNLTSQQVKDAMHTMLHDSLLRARVQEMQQVFRSAGGTPLAVKVIEDALTQIRR